MKSFFDPIPVPIDVHRDPARVGKESLGAQTVMITVVGGPTLPCHSRYFPKWTDSANAIISSVGNINITTEVDRYILEIVGVNTNGEPPSERLQPAVL
jgi:hypothetical protein